MKFILLSCLGLVSALYSGAQELYVFTEPASNMPARSIGLKLTGRFPQKNIDGTTQRYTGELMFGIDQHWMVHVSGSLSDYYQRRLKADGVKTYVKYRFYSNDEVHRHFRMAAFAEGAYSVNPYKFMDANLDGDNSGAQAGLIATQLINRVAVSATASYLRVFKDNNDNLQSADLAYNLLNYSLSAGYLLLPREYVDYSQTNVNLYVEMLGMQALDAPHYGVDIAPALQFIFNSNTKLNLGYKFQLGGNMDRLAKRQWQIAIEHTLFNAL